MPFAALAPVAFRIPGHPARMLHGFAQTERSSMVDLLAAANQTPSASRRALYLRHALDEARHAVVFAHRSNELRRAAGAPTVAPPRADTERLFERLGELRFLAFVQLGEARGRAEFEGYARICRRLGDERTAAVFEAILVDERRHEVYTRTLLAELAGSDAAARRELRRAAAWELSRLWLRAGRALSARLHAVVMIALYFAVAPLALLVRWRSPAPVGWTAPCPAPTPAPSRRNGPELS